MKAPLWSLKPTSLVEGEFGPWMLVQQSSKVRITMKLSRLVGGASTGQYIRIEEKGIVKMSTSTYGVHAEWKEEARTSDILKSKAKAKVNQSEETSRALVVYKEEGKIQRKGECIVEIEKSFKRNVSQGGTSIYMERGKKNVNPGKMEIVVADHIEGEAVGQKIFVQKKNKEPKSIGHRVHLWSPEAWEIGHKCWR